MTVNFKYVRNHDEYVLFVEQMKYNFDYVHDWEYFFEIKDMNSIRDLRVCPPDYPCFIYCNFIDNQLKFPARVIDFLPVRDIVTSKNYFRSLNMIINKNILVDGADALANRSSDEKENVKSCVIRTE